MGIIGTEYNAKRVSWSYTTVSVEWSRESCGDLVRMFCMRRQLMVSETK